MNTRHIPYGVALTLLIGGITLVVWHLQTRTHTPVRPGDSFWKIGYEVDFTATAAGSKVRITLPAENRYGRVYAQEVSAPGLEVRRIRHQHTDNRELLLTASQPGTYRIQVEVALHRTGRPFAREERFSGSGTPQQGVLYLQSEPSIPLEHPVVKESVEALKSQVRTKASLIGRIFDFCSVQLKSGGREGPQDAVGVLTSGQAGPGGRCFAMVALCRQAGIPARLVTGFVLYRSVEPRPRMWVEVWSGNRWESYDPESALGREMAAWRIPVRYGKGTLVRSRGSSSLRARYFLIPVAGPEEGLSGSEETWTDIFDFTRLPVEMHPALEVLLLMPIGALVTSGVRVIIGMTTLGTFTPALLALSFLYADWRTGLIILAAVLTVGLVSRVPLDRLKLLVVPRLSVMLTLVVLTMSGVVSILDYTGWSPGPEAVLLPMVIMTMAIERFYLHMEEDGLASAGKLLVGTALVALCCYGVLQWKSLGRFLLKYPEVHLVTIALLILMGRYTGYRFSEFWRFRDFLNTPPSSSILSPGNNSEEIT